MRTRSLSIAVLAAVTTVFLAAAPPAAADSSPGTAAGPPPSSAAGPPPSTAAGSPPAHAAWLRPVPGGVSRAFVAGASPFAGGQHRGVDLRAAPGTIVRSACAGRVLFAGGVPGSGRAVTVRCGRWRVTYLHLSAIAVRRGRLVGRGGRIGRSGRPPGGRPHLHVGVRRDGSTFGYVDPLAFFGRAGPPASPVVLPVRSPRRPAHPRRIRPAGPPRASPVHAPASLPLAPWPAWAGAALLLAGAWPAAARGRRRRRAAAPHRLAAGVASRG